MKKYNVSWNMFGYVTVAAEDEDAAVQAARDWFDDEFWAVNSDGSDVGDTIEEASEWEDAINDEDD